jgi:hypothetical protein
LWERLHYAKEDYYTWSEEKSTLAVVELLILGHTGTLPRDKTMGNLGESITLSTQLAIPKSNPEMVASASEVMRGLARIHVFQIITSKGNELLQVRDGDSLDGHFIPFGL